MRKKLRQRREEQKVLLDLAACALWYVVEKQHPMSSSMMLDHEYQRMERAVDALRKDNVEFYSYIKGVS